MSNDGYVVRLNEPFGPVPTYKSYLAIYSVLYVMMIWLPITCIYVFIPEIDLMLRVVAAVTTLIIVAGLTVFWSFFYFNSIQYMMNDTEITWKRGVFFKKTGIVPYNRITDVMISQGPIMRIFGISHVGIQTAGGRTPNGNSEIRIEGQLHATELRAIMMDHIRSINQAGGATVGVAETVKHTQTGSDGELLEEIRKIRELLEKKQ